VFLVNLPVGIITVVGLLFFMQETQVQKHLRFDWFGFGALSIGIGALQLMLDRGEQVGWFDSNEIVIEAIIGVTGFYYFFAHSLTTERPFVRFALFKDRNYTVGCVFMAVMGISIFATMALVTPFMQNVIGYPILTAGILLASRGCGTLVGMMAVGRMVSIIQPKYLILAGLILTAGTLHQMSAFTNDTASNEIVVTSLIQGFGLALVFIPLNTVAFATLPAQLRTDGTAIFTLIRNIGSAVGISIVIANLTRMTTSVHANLTTYVTPFNTALQMPDVAAKIDLATDAGRALMDQIVTQQAAIIAYGNDFRLLMWIAIAAMPFVFLVGAAPRKQAPGPKDEPVHVMD
jgi:DHA2 family multidrug resistance protein